MRRRRHQKNPLLMRIIVISIVIHIIALPILAHFGAFKKIQQHFVEAKMIVLPPPEKEKEKPEVKPKRVAQKPARTAKKSTTTTPHQRMAARRSNLNQPKVVASAGGGPGDNGAGTIDNSGTGQAGVVPTPQADTTKPTVKADTPPPVEVKPKTQENTAPAAPKPTPPVEVKPKTQEVTTPVAPPKAPVFTAAEPLGGMDSQPKPQIPDDLRTEALDKTCVAEFTVAPDGAPSDVKIAQSSGNDELDRLALDAARKWKFKPATRDGQPIESHVRLHIEFQVS